MHASFNRTTTSIRQNPAILVAAAILLSGRFAHVQDTQTLPGLEFHIRPYDYGPGYPGICPSHSWTHQEGLPHGYSDLLRSAEQRELSHYEALRRQEAAVEMKP